MFFLPRLTVSLVTVLVIVIGVCYPSTAAEWKWRFAPLYPPSGDADVLSSGMPVAPQFIRIVIAQNQVTIGAAEPYIRNIKRVPPPRFKTLPRSAPQPVARSRASSQRHQLRGPEAFLLRRTQNVAGQTFP